MGFGNSVMNLFSGQQPAPAPAKPGAQQPNPQQNLGGAGSGSNGEQSGSVALENANPNNGQQQQKQQQEASPLDPFKDLWEPTKVAPDKGTPSNDGTPAKPKAPDFAGMAKKIDFARLIPPELTTKALGGDSAAFNQILNQVTQASLGAAMRMAHQFSETNGATVEERINSSLSGRFKEFSVQNTPIKNSAAKHPALRPVVDLIKQQLTSKHPDADASEIAQHAENYVSAMIAEAAKDGKKAEEVAAREEPGSAADILKQQQLGSYDWNNFASGPGQT